MEEVGFGISKLIPGAWARPCDTCKSATAVLYCRPHSLFFCVACDTDVHAVSHAPPHARVWLCEVCEHDPAAVTCKADNAALCVACDSDIHSANPLARRHDRLPVVPFFDSAVSAAAAAAAGMVIAGDDDVAIGCQHAAPSEWVCADLLRVKCSEFLFSDTERFLDFDGTGTGTDSVVPVHTMRKYEEATTKQIINQLSSKCVEIDFANSKFNSIDRSRNFLAQSISQSISSSSMDVGVVPDGSSLSDISHPYIRPSGTTVDRFGSTGTNGTTQGSDREARVMRYREKRKNRKFEKTIRYASRKAYAETRPRIKGRFAKRSETEPELMNQLFIPNSSAFLADVAGYGIVPSF